MSKSIRRALQVLRKTSSRLTPMRFEATKLLSQRDEGTDSHCSLESKDAEAKSDKPADPRLTTTFGTVQTVQHGDSAPPGSEIAIPESSASNVFSSPPTSEQIAADTTAKFPPTPEQSSPFIESSNRSAITSANHGRRRLVATRADQIPIEKIDWLWDQWIAAGTLSLLAGREGQGKSTLAASIVAALTKGTLPGEYYGQPQYVIYVATEDSWAHTLIPRFMAAGADLTRILKIQISTEKSSLSELDFPEDIEDLKQYAELCAVKLLVLDPLTSRLSGSLDTHKDSQVRQALEPLVSMADGVGMSILGIIHLNKSSKDPLNAVMGSKAFTAVARSVLSVVADPDDETESRKFLGVVKSNLAQSMNGSRVFQIISHHVESDDGENISTSKVEWQADTDLTIKSIMADPSMEVRTRLDECCAWLRNYLPPGVEKPRKELVADACKDGFTESTLKRASNKIGVISERRGTPPNSYWSLPESTIRDRSYRSDIQE